VQEDGADHARVFDKRNNFQDAPAVRAEQRVQFEDLLDEAGLVAAGGLRRADVVRERDWNRSQRLLLRLLTPAAAALHARVVRVITHKVFSTIRNMRGDRHEKIQRIEKGVVPVRSRGPLGSVLELLVVLLDQAAERSWLAAGRVLC